MAQISSLHPRTPSPDQEAIACRICSVDMDKFLDAAVLVCGHFYHADCLESLTPEGERYDPPCPICTRGKKSAAKLLGKFEPRAKKKLSKIAVADGTDKQNGKAPKIGASSGVKNAAGKPFFERQFSTGRPPRSLSGNESTKRSFRERRRRD